jgi:hypothetical protein
MSRETDLQSEQSLHRDYLAAPVSSEHPASLLVRAQSERRLAEVEGELAELRYPPLDVRVAGEVTERHALPVPILRAIIGRLQATVTWIGWAIESGAAVAGTVPASIERATAAEIYALAPGSFRFGFRPSPDPNQIAGQATLDNVPPSPLYELAVTTIVAASDLAAHGNFGTDLEAQVKQMGPGAARRFQLLAKTLAEAKLRTEMTLWAREVQSVVLTPDRAAELGSWLGDYIEDHETITVDGVLSILDAETGRFAIRDAQEHRYAGSADAELLAGAAVEGEQYRAVLEITRRQSAHTAASKELTRLLSLTLLDDQD